MRVLFISTCDANAAQGILSNYGHPLGLCRQGGPHPHHNNQFVVQGSPQLNSLNMNSAHISSTSRSGCLPELRPPCAPVRGRSAPHWRPAGQQRRPAQHQGALHRTACAVCGYSHLHKVVKKLGGTVDDTEGFEGLVFAQKVAKVAGGPSRVEKAKIAVLQASARTHSTALPSHRIFVFSSVVFFISCPDLAMNPNCPLLQFCLSPPKVQPHPPSHIHLPFASPLLPPTRRPVVLCTAPIMIAAI